MIFKDLFYILPRNIQIQVIGLEDTSEGAEITQRCYSYGTPARIERDMMTVNVGKYKLKDVNVLQVDPIMRDFLQITIIDK